MPDKNQLSASQMSDIQRIMVIGPCGAGKSTLAKQIQQCTNLPVIHLDQHYWQSGWIETEKPVWEKKVQKLVEQPRWIIDGNYGGTMDIRLQIADLIVFLDRSRWLCTYRILKRSLLSYGKSRPDMADGCPERFNLEFLHYTFTFNDLRRPGLLKKLAQWENQTPIVRLSNQREIDQFLINLSATFQNG